MSDYNTDDAEKLPDFREADFFLDMEKVEIGPQIGVGHFSKVYIARYFGDLVAVKKQHREQKAMDGYLLRELSVLKHVTHPNLLVYVGAQNDVEPIHNGLESRYVLWIVTELARGGDFLRMLLRDGVEISWPWRLHMLRDAADALTYLHENNLIHRDIKGANLLLDVDENGKWICKLSDFGMARPVAAVEEKRRLTICGTEDYMAPELLFDEEYGAAADIFSLGMVILEALARQGIGNSGSTHYAVRRPASRFVLHVAQLKEQFTEGSPDSLVILASQCTAYDADERPSALEVKDWLEGIIEESYGGLQSEYAGPDPEPLPAWGLEDVVSAGENEDQLEDESPGDEGSIVKAGWLYKRNRHGFRNWKRRWFVLTHKELMWYTRREDREPKGVLKLLNCTLKTVKAYRWQILDTSDMSKVTDTRLHNRELAADSRKQMNEWLEKIQLVIDRLNETAFGSPEVRPSTRTSTAGEILAKAAADALAKASEAATRAAATKDVEDQRVAAELATAAAQAASRAAVIREALSPSITDSRCGSPDAV
mmetsp:Transcript_8013/g.29988  ORF Transcript_8013/g.29988 Transcript_8013/m.29988 type:complete len:540 (-) Transcript_8013:36-1655(-)